ncbi:MAG: hypothetical protein GF392_02475 [Candidatus Omnitrophica bacterium]|nr:hypothetical protein [Candidatus Omnitrophota bacterium]
MSLVAVAILSLIFIFAYLFSRNFTIAHQDNGSLRVALIQGDVGNRGFFGYSEDLDDRISRYIELSRKASKQRPDIILWPEYSLPVDVMNMFPAKMAPVIDQIKRSDTEYIIGSLLNDPDNPRIKYNAALIFSGNGDLSNVYFSEEPAIFNKGITPRTNKSGLFSGNAGILLCWEEVSERISRRYIEEGAEYLFALSSNAALDHSWFKDYISYFSRARAAENMRYLARVTQSGITHIIDPVGRVTAHLPPDRADFITQKIHALKRRTFYSVYGDILVRILALVFSIPVMTGLVRPVLSSRKTGCEE